MPFTRTDEFGWLPSLLAIILLAALLIAIRRGPGAAVSAIYRVRHSDIAAQLGLAIGGFFTLVLLTALAGSELAIKNARYLLTIAPLVVVFLMVVIGKILPEGRLLAGKLAGAARTVLRPVTPLLPARLHRWQTAQTSEPNSLAGVPLAFLVVSALLLCGLVQALATLRATYANAAVYVGAGVPGWSRFTEAERMKRDGSVLPDAIVERIVRERVGKDERHFLVLKFRTMKVGTQQELWESEEQVSGFVANDFKLSRNDSRITTVGRVLRRTGLDELPQLVNILRGEMSLVGVRPLVPAELALRPEIDQQLYCRLRPGVTGLWQTSGRSTVLRNRRIAMDRRYSAEWHPWEDLKILVRTPRSLFRTDETG
jgi:lipopolysaccharide/colanic/teichoic acid biosynthesis glycosyltransferase